MTWNEKKDTEINILFYLVSVKLNTISVDEYYEAIALWIDLLPFRCNLLSIKVSDYSTKNKMIDFKMQGGLFLIENIQSYTDAHKNYVY